MTIDELISCADQYRDKKKVLEVYRARLLKAQTDVAECRRAIAFTQEEMSKIESEIVKIRDAAALISMATNG